MKYLILLLVVLAVVWLARSGRGRVEPPRRPGGKGPAGSADSPQIDGEVMLACAHCGLHLPRSEALPGRGGVFCSAAHRAIAEARDGRA